MARKVFASIGIVVCILICITGRSLLKATPEDEVSSMSSPQSPGLTDDYGYASFGSDYYTYSNNNMAMAGYGAKQTARNLRYLGAQELETGRAIYEVGGVIVIAIGLIGLFYFVCMACEQNYNRDIPTYGPGAPAKPIPVTPSVTSYAPTCNPSMDNEG